MSFPDLILLDDLHLEHRSQDERDDILDKINTYLSSCAVKPIVVLAGDIHEGIEGIQWAKGIKTQVVYVAGNHEFWGQDYFELINQLEKESENSHVHFLHNNILILAGFRFIGATLWTSLGNEIKHWEQQEQFSHKNPISHYVQFYMNDFHKISAKAWYDNTKNLEKLKKWAEAWNYNDYVKNALWNPLIEIEENEKSQKFIEKELKTPFDGKTIVVSHHLPTQAEFIHAGFDASQYLLQKHDETYFQQCAKAEIPANKNILKAYAYANSLDKLFHIKKKNSEPVIDKWLHGHLHHPVDYVYHKVQIASNPIGYKWQKQALVLKSIDMNLSNMEVLALHVTEELEEHSFAQLIDTKTEVYQQSIIKIVNLVSANLISTSDAKLFLISLCSEINVQIDEVNQFIRSLLLPLILYKHELKADETQFLTNQDYLILSGILENHTEVLSLFSTEYDKYDMSRNFYFLRPVKFHQDITPDSFIEHEILMAKMTHEVSYDFFNINSHYSYWLDELNGLKKRVHYLESYLKLFFYLEK